MSASNTQCSNQQYGLHGYIIEGWGQGYMVGGLSMLMFQTISSIKSKRILHKLIMLELILAATHGTFILVSPPALGWYLSSTATLLYLSYNLHNIINWIKVKPFLPRWASVLYIGTVALVFPYWVAEMYLNFAYINDLGTDYFRHTRPWEAFCREPWWIFTSIYLVVVIKRSYDCGVRTLVQTSTRFGVLLVIMSLSIVLIILDVVEVATGPQECAGRNPYWKIALALKCAADAVFLDDFKTVLDSLYAQQARRRESTSEQSRSRRTSTDKDIKQQRELFNHQPAKQRDRRRSREWFDSIDPAEPR